MKYEKEITVEIDCTLDELDDKLRKYSFEIVGECLIKDIYMLDKNCKNIQDKLELLKHCLLIRNIKTKDEEIRLIEYKNKEYNEKQEIVNEGKVYCKVESIKSAKTLLEAINYEELIRIHDHFIAYSNGTDELSVQIVNNKHIYIEIEEICNYIDKKYETVEEMKKVISKYNIPIKNNDYYVKKALIELAEKCK